MEKLIKQALHWWFDKLSQTERDNFPEPEDNLDILDYYIAPNIHKNNIIIYR